MNINQTLLSAALAAALFAVAPTFAQDTSTDTELVANASVPKDRLIERYADVAGSEDAAEALVTDLRTGGDFTVTTTETRPVLNPDGTQATNPDGSPKTEVVTVETAVVNPNGPMGWGEVNITLALAQKLVDSGEFADLQSALTGTADVTNPDGTVVEGTSGILQMRADGMGWGQIAKELGFNLGAVVGNGNGKSQAGADRAEQAKGKTERTTGKPDRVAKVERPSRPDKVERPQKPERPDRPQKPDRAGRP